MIATTPALLVSPNGEVEELLLDSRHADQLRCIGFYVEDPRAHQLGRRAVVHAGHGTESVNDVARQAWMSITGGSRPPLLRGPVVITGATNHAGDLTPLPELSAEAIQRAAGLLSGATTIGFKVSAVQHCGGRNYQCDSYAINRNKNTGRWAFAVLDGIGDRLEVHHFAQRFAPLIAREAARHGSPARALAAARVQARNELRWDFDPRTDPSAVAVVAVADHRSPLIHVAWCGDARAYRLAPIGISQPVTHDHNYAQDLRSRGRTPGPYDRNFITSCVMNGDIGAATIERGHTRRLLLCTDGAYAPLEERGQDVGGILDLADDAKGAAALVVDDAIAASADEFPDNATALVVDIVQA
ncbi:protein phosphatase 2C domain-containing protein [Streptomyces sp. NBC_01275]|uniref:PP2C family protein-serine/threonine phosphatase n=1 Tax=Streptomyces sp. NBC_01275 TaxID=2903807 RepID=UPI0022504BB4|nr:protein phosphatase 2C domain-containing protein [Streptomyces sp. NBC_01275]MCX4761877.1 protein phosphatase 2C domain-containing protein [Streptomyces sp. NBC_01275]